VLGCQPSPATPHNVVADDFTAAGFALAAVYCGSGCGEMRPPPPMSSDVRDHYRERRHCKSHGTGSLADARLGTIPESFTCMPLRKLLVTCMP
jgi:hypothetical protein